MKLTSVGAARTVTGSCHLLEIRADIGRDATAMIQNETLDLS